MPFKGVFSQFVFQQEWEPNPGFLDEANDIVQHDGSGDFLITGNTGLYDPPNLPDDDIYLIRTDDNGDLIWSFIYETNFIPLEANSVAAVPGPQGGFIIAGTAIPATGNMVFVLRVDANGAVLWNAFYPDPNGGRGVAFDILSELDSQGNVQHVLTGEILQNGQEDVFFMKIDDNGNLLNGLQFPRSGTRDRGNDIEVTAAGYAIAVQNLSLAGDFTVYYLNGNGFPLWNNVYNWGSASQAVDLEVLSNQGLVVVGHTQNPSAGDWDVSYLNLDASGTVQYGFVDTRAGDQWARSAGSQSTDVVGLLSFDDISSSSQLMSIDGNTGTWNWGNQYNASVFSNAKSVYATAELGWTFTGEQSLTGEIVQIKTDLNGFAACSTVAIQPLLGVPMIREENFRLSFLSMGDPEDLTVLSQTLEPDQEKFCCSSAALCGPGPVRPSFNRQLTINPSDQQAFAMEILENGNVIMAGTQQAGGNGNRDNLLVQTDGEGNLCQVLEIDHNREEWYIGIHQRPDDCGDFFTTGFEITPTGDFDMFVSRHLADGVPVWTNRLDNLANREQGFDLVHNINIKPNGDTHRAIVAAGYTESIGNGAQDGLLTAYEEDGTHLWTRVYGYGGNDRFNAIILRTPNNLPSQLIAVGESVIQGGLGFLDSWLVRIGTSGLPVASRRFGLERGDDRANDVVRGPNGDFYVVGQCRTLQTQPWNMYVARFDPNLNQVYFNIIGNTNADDVAFAVDYNFTNDRLYIAGFTQGFNAANRAATVVEVEPLTGAVSQAVIFDGPEDEVFQDIKIDGQGRPIASGSTNSYNPGDQEVYMVKLDNMNADCAIPVTYTEWTLPTVLDTDLPGLVFHQDVLLVDVEDNLLQEEMYNVCPYNGPVTVEDEHNQEAASIFAKNGGNSFDYSLKISPNPASNRVKMEYQFEKEAKRSLELINLQGQVLKSSFILQMQGSASIELEEIPAGIYLIRIKGGPEGGLTKRLIIN